MDDELFDDLASPDDVTRGIAYGKIYASIDDDIAEALLRIAESERDESIREDAIIAFGPVFEECGDDYAGEDDLLDDFMLPEVSRQKYADAHARITALYRDEKQPTLIRRRAFEVLVRDPRPALEKEVARLYRSPDVDWRMTAVFAMGYVKGFEREIVAALDAGEPEIVIEAVEAAGRMGIRAAARRIRKLATSKTIDHDLRLAAISALPGVDPDCAELLEELRDSDEIQVADAAADALDELSIEQGFYPGEDEEEEDDLPLDENDAPGGVVPVEIRDFPRSGSHRAGGTGLPSARPVAPSPRTGRNEPCPCGSGKKFKKCCGA